MMNRKKFYISAAGLLLLVVALGVYGYLAAIPPVIDSDIDSPIIAYEPLEYNFGNVEYGQILTHDFIITNKGNAQLRLLEVSTSCGCTTALVDKDVLEVGESTTLTAVYKTDAMTGAHAKGQQERIIFINNNDPNQPLARIMIYANVQ